MEAIGIGERLIAAAFADLNELTKLGDKLTEKNRAAVAAAFGLTEICLAVGTVAALVFALLAWFALSTGIARPINAMSQFMEKLAGGDYDQETASQDRKDEIGNMARSVEFFRNRLIENREMQKKTEAEQAERVQRANKLTDITARFDTTVSEVLAVVSSASTELQATASSMRGTAEQTTKQSLTVAVASEQTAGNVQTVATATTELTASIGEITTQMSRSRERAVEAVAEAAAIEGKVQSLVAAA